MLKHTYFSLDGLGPRSLLERRLNPYRHARRLVLRGGRLDLRWTARAHRELRRRGAPLLVEMQIYFACIVKKRVLFPASLPAQAVDVGDLFRVHLSTLEADRCDPVTFATQYPIRRELTTPAAGRMRARELLLDYRAGGWRGEFYI